MFQSLKAALLGTSLFIGAFSIHAEVYSWSASSESPLYKTDGETLSLGGKNWTMEYVMAKGIFSCDFYANYGLWFTYGFNDAGLQSLRLSCNDFKGSISKARIIMTNDKCTDSNFYSGFCKTNLIVGGDTIQPTGITPMANVGNGWTAEYIYDEILAAGNVCISFEAECAAFILNKIEIETSDAAVAYTTNPVIAPNVSEITTLTPITITSDPDAVTYYTTDGSTPTVASAVYSTPIYAPAGSDVTIKAISKAPGKVISQVVSHTFTSVIIDELTETNTWSYTVTPDSPTISADNLTVTLNDKQWTAAYTGVCSYIANAKNYGYYFGYNDLNSLTFSSDDFHGRITEVRVAALDLNYSDWAGTDASFNVTVGDSIYECTSKKISDTQPAVAEYVFTTNEPISGRISLNFKAQNGQFFINSIAVDEVIERTATPVISPDVDEMISETPIFITCNDPDARIYYTLDGSFPTTTATEYTAPIILTEPGNILLRVIAIAPGKRQSHELIKTFTVKDSDDNPTGISIINSDTTNSETEYFTISGMRVAASSLRPGIYIMRKGQTTTKIIIR